MLDIKFIRENSKLIAQAAKDKGVEIDISLVLDIDEKYQNLLSEVQKLREERNKAAQDRSIEKGRQIKKELDSKETELQNLEAHRTHHLSQIPNPAKKDVIRGKSEEDNEIIRTEGAPVRFDFAPKDHLELGEALDIIDLKRAAHTSGSRFAYLKNEAVVLEFALASLAFEILQKEGFVPIIPPELIKTETMEKIGYMEHGGAEDMFHLEKDALTLIGTAEHSIVAMHRDELFQRDDLPRRYVGFSSSFRREAGSYGRDTRGIFRVHQFDKIEMVSLVEEAEDDKEQEYLLGLEERLWKALEIPYRVVKVCTAELGFPVARKFDIEAWFPSQGKYREVTSCSTTTDFQARRLNIRYETSLKQAGQSAQAEGGLNIKQPRASVKAARPFVYILNGTGFAIGRTIAAILENYQKKDGSVEIPQVLQKYMGKTVIKPQ